MERNGRLIRQKYYQYLFSTIAMSAAMYLAVLVDSILVGNILGADELSAVNLCNPIVFVANAVFCIIIYGGSTMAATYIGRQDREGADAIYSLSLVSCVVIQTVASVFGMIFCHQIASLLTGGGALTELVEAYLFPSLLGMPILFFSNGMVSFARLDGFMSVSAIVPIVSNVVNLIFDYIFMKYLHMGIAGASYATLAGYVVGSVFLLGYFCSSKRAFHLTKKITRIKTIVREIVETGLPTSLTNVCSFFRTLVINSILLATLGNVGVLTMAICMNATTLVNIVTQGASNTILPVAGTLYGEKDRKGIVYAFRNSTFVSLLMAVILIVFFEIYPQSIAYMCGIHDQETLSAVIPAFRIFVISLFFVSIIYQLKSLYQATGNQNAASVVTVIEGAAIIIPLFFVISKVCPTYIWTAFVIAEILSLVLILLYATVISKKKKLSRFLLLGFEDHEKLFDVTIDNTIESAVGLSKQLMTFCEEHGVDSRKAIRIATAAEEMTVNTAKYAYKKGRQDIDISLRILEEKLILKIRDSGEIFNPLEAVPKQDDGISGIEFVKKAASKLSYNRALGFNVTIVTIDR